MYSQPSSRLQVSVVHVFSSEHDPEVQGGTGAPVTALTPLIEVEPQPCVASS